MKKIGLVLATALALLVGFVSCEKETVVIDGCETCQGANIILSPQTKTDVNRDGVFAWVDAITVIAQDVDGVDYGDVFQLVDDGSGADGFFLSDLPVNQDIDFSASSTSVVDSSNGQYLEQIADPNTLDALQARLVFATYATDAPQTQYIVNGDNTVTLNMNTTHGRIISSFQLAESFQTSGNGTDPDFRVSVTQGDETEQNGGTAGVTHYWNDVTSVAGATQSYTVQLIQVSNDEVLMEREIVETVLASTSVTNKYVVGLGIVLSSSVEVLFSWQAWNDENGINEIPPPPPAPFTLHPNGVTLVAGPTAVTGQSYDYNGTSYLVVDDATIAANKTANIVTTRVTDMYGMFYSASAFNGDISSWDTAAVTDMRFMFYSASAFNGDISSWNTAAVTNMYAMFGQASAFNGDISSWDTAAVTNMGFMFQSASAFNQNLSGWCVTNITSEPQNFSTGSPLTPTNKPVWGSCD